MYADHLVLVLSAAGCLVVVFDAFGLRLKLWRWLKGSRVSYFLQLPITTSLYWASRGNRTDQKLRVGAERILGFNPGSIIEINRGLFRRWSAIYGNHHLSPMCWDIRKIWKIPGGGGDCVKLQDIQGLEVGDALRLINTYPSLQAMLDRIAELEKELVIANDRRAEWLAATSALHCEITTDRKRYRSPAAGHIRECLDVIIEWANQDKDKFPINIKKTRVWKDRFPSRVA